MALLQDRILVTISAASEGAVRELQDLEKSAKGSDDAVLNLSKSLKTGLVAGAAALAGTGLVAFLNDSVQAFQESQQAALQFARATNATVEEAGKFTTVARTLGLDLNDLIEVNAEFSKKIAEQPQLLADIGVEIAKNADGSVNMTRTLVETIDALGSMEDGLKAAQIAAQLFGEEGSKQLAGFYLQGIEVADLMDRIDFVDQSDKAKRFAASTIEMNLAMEQLQVTLGAEIVPLMTGLADAATDVVLFMSQIPTEVYLAVGGFLALRQVFRTLGAQRVVDGLLNITAAAASPIQATKTLATNIANIARANAGNIAFAGLLIGYSAYTVATDNAEARAREFLGTLAELERQGVDTADAFTQTAEKMQESGSFWERFVNALNTSDQGFWANPNIIGRAIDAIAEAAQNGEYSLESYEQVLEEAREEAGAYGEVAADAAFTQGNLNEVIAEFVRRGQDSGVTYEDIAAAAESAAGAQAQQEEVTRLTAEALAIASGNAGYFLDRLKEIENIGGSSVEGIKASLQGLDFADVADTWANEAKISAERAYDTIVDGLIAAVEQNPQLDLSAWLEQFRGFAPELDAVIDQVLADAGADTQLQTSLEVARGESVADAESALAGLEDPTVGTFDLTTGEGVAAAKAAREEIGAPIETTLVVDTSFEPGGYTAIKARKDFLAKAVDTDLAIDVAFGPGGYNAVKARKDYLTRDRTAYIDVVVRGASAAREQLASLNAVAVVGSASTAAPVVNNSVRVDLDGFQLRSVVREEVRFASTSAGGLP